MTTNKQEHFKILGFLSSPDIGMDNSIVILDTSIKHLDNEIALREIPEDTKMPQLVTWDRNGKPHFARTGAATYYTTFNTDICLKWNLGCIYLDTIWRSWMLWYRSARLNDPDYMLEVENQGIEILQLTEGK